MTPLGVHRHAIQSDYSTVHAGWVEPSSTNHLYDSKCKQSYNSIPCFSLLCFGNSSGITGCIADISATVPSTPSHRF